MYTVMQGEQVARQNNSEVDVIVPHYTFQKPIWWLRSGVNK